jgi:hypothetical protein
MGEARNEMLASILDAIKHVMENPHLRRQLFGPAAFAFLIGGLLAWALVQGHLPEPLAWVIALPLVFAFLVMLGLLLPVWKRDAVVLSARERIIVHLLHLVETGNLRGAGPGYISRITNDNQPGMKSRASHDDLVHLFERLKR